MRVAREVEVSRIFPPKENQEDTVTTTIRVPKSLAAAVDKIVDDERRSKTEVLLHLIRYGVQEWEAEKERPQRAAK